MVLLGEYRLLHKYLDGRFADTVVLRFNEIEDIVGFTLPADARLHEAWWAVADGGGQPSEQSQAWTGAQRTATANMTAQKVTFERTPD